MAHQIKAQVFGTSSDDGIRLGHLEETTEDELTADDHIAVGITKDDQITHQGIVKKREDCKPAKVIQYGPKGVSTVDISKFRDGKTKIFKIVYEAGMKDFKTASTRVTGKYDFGKYNVNDNNCMTYAFYCETGKKYVITWRKDENEGTVWFFGTEKKATQESITTE